jgi:threonine dehydratase
VKRTGAARVSFKREDEQTTGSFKLRGVANKLLTLTPVERAQTVITASSGNHGRAIAYMARQLALSATIVVSRSAPETKKAGIRRYGAELVEIGTTYDHAEEYATELAEATGSILIHECEDERILAGHGTVGLEMLEENPSIDILLIPAGGGGLLCGAAIAALLAGRVDVKGKNVATILSGRNVDAGKFEAITKFVK